MANFKVEVGGTNATDVIDVEYDKTEGADIGQATVTVGNTSANRSLFQSGSDVVIKREDPANPGTFDTEWRGEVTGSPSNTSRRNVTLEVECETKLGQLEYGKVGRPFIQMDTGKIVEQAVEKVVEPNTSPRFISTGSDLTNWDSDAGVFELANINKKRLNEFGSDLLYADFGEGESGTWHLTYDDVDFGEAPGRQILKVEMRMLVNNRGNVFEGEFELRDHDGINYVWSLDIPGYAGFKTYELTPDDAEYGGGELTTDGSCEIRVSSDGGLPEDRALVVDMIRSTPFSLNDRNTSVTANSVESTGRTITRRLDGSILEIASTLAQEDGAAVYIDDSNDLHYETAGDTSVPANLNITDDGSVPVVDVEVDRDYDVRNRVTVQGKGDLQATFEDSASIDFYNTEAPKEEPIVDKSIRTKSGLESRARGFLNDHAWEDSAMSFTIGDASFKDVGVGQSIDVTWGPEDVDGTFIVSSVSTTPEGYVVIGMTGNTTA